VVEEQLKHLGGIKKKKLKSILEAFYLPPLNIVKSKGKSARTLALFLGRMQTEADPIFSIIDRQFSECRSRFIEAFRECLPKASEAELQWQFEFMLSLIVCFLTRQTEIRKRYGDFSDWAPEVASRQMIDFCLGGMLARVTPKKSKS